MMAAGVGAEVTLELGGKTDMPSIGVEGEPLRLTGKVRRLSDGEWVVRGPMYTGSRVTTGPTALFDTGGLSIVVTSLHHEPWDLGIFTAIGLDPQPLPLPAAEVAHPLPRRLRAARQGDHHARRRRA